MVENAIIDLIAKKRVTFLEARVLLVFIRLTVGYKEKESVMLSIAQLCEHTEAARANVQTAVKALCTKGLLHKEPGKLGRAERNRYAVNYDADDWNFAPADPIRPKVSDYVKGNADMAHKERKGHAGEALSSHADMAHTGHAQVAHNEASDQAQQGAVAGERKKKEKERHVSPEGQARHFLIRDQETALKRTDLDRQELDWQVREYMRATWGRKVLPKHEELLDAYLARRIKPYRLLQGVIAGAHALNEANDKLLDQGKSRYGDPIAKNIEFAADLIGSAILESRRAQPAPPSQPPPRNLTADYRAALAREQEES